MPIPHNRVPRRSYGAIFTLAAGAGSLLSATLAPAHAVTPEVRGPVCEVATDATAVELSNRYNAALQTRHPDRVARLFSADAALLGFASPVARADYAAIREYFLYFLQYEPQIKFESRQVDVACNVVIDAGSYIWTLKAKDANQPEKLPARYRIIYEYNGSDWQISEHIEELTSDKASDTAFVVPEPQASRASAPTATTVPTVAGYLKRSGDVLSPGETPAPEPKTRAKPEAEKIEPTRLGAKPRSNQSDVQPAQSKPTKQATPDLATPVNQMWLDEKSMR